MTVATPLLVTGSVLLAARAVRVRVDARAARVLAGFGSAKRAGPGDDSSEVGGSTRLAARIGRGALGERVSRSPALRRRVELAGVTGPGSPPIDEVAGRKILSGGVAAITVLALAAFAPLAAVALPVALIAYRLPDVALARAARRRRERMEHQVSELAELLLTATEAGLGLAIAVERAAGLVGGPLGHEVRVVVGQVGLGVPWGTALERLAERASAPSVGRLVRTLDRSRRLGVPAGTALRGVAQELRAERRARAEEAARRAPVKMLFPLVFLILPAFLLLTVGPVFLSTLRSLG